MASCPGLRLAILPRAKEIVTQSFTTIWQPRALPATAFANESRLLGERNSAEEALLLRVLDCLAMQYTVEMLKYVSVTVSEHELHIESIYTTVPDDFVSGFRHP
jgi:hypothetical protein